MGTFCVFFCGESSSTAVVVSPSYHRARSGVTSVMCGIRDGRIVGEAFCSGYVIPTNLPPLMGVEKMRERKEACPCS